MNPFEFVNAVSYTKKDIITDENESHYSSFLVNRSLSYFQDSVLLANEMNKYHQIDNKLQSAFLINTLRKRKRFSKWQKHEMASDLKSVMDYYGYSEEKALQVYPLLSGEQLKIIQKKVSRGGRKQ
tara:strand:+ start:1240 stop:1617 length:378 start_codon:yes stop_codon:yes gene_type:complete